MKEKFYHFFQNRYGNDALNQFLFIVELILFVLIIFTRNIVCNFLFLFVVILYFYRSLSKNIVARSLENDRYVHMQKNVKHHFQAWKSGHKDKEHKYFVCPACTQLIRVPKGKGKLEIRCPYCHTKFERKS